MFFSELIYLNDNHSIITHFFSLKFIFLIENSSKSSKAENTGGQGCVSQK